MNLKDGHISRRDADMVVALMAAEQLPVGAAISRVAVELGKKPKTVSSNYYRLHPGPRRSRGAVEQRSFGALLADHYSTIDRVAPGPAGDQLRRTFDPVVRRCYEAAELLSRRS